MADDLNTFLPEDQFPDDLDPAATLDVLDERLVDPTAPPPDLAITTDTTQSPGRSWSFDFVAERFVVRASGVAQTRGLGTLRQWIEKSLRTDRGAHPIHSDDYGMVRPFDMIGMPLVAISRDSLKQRIEDALVVHPLIAGVQDFAMDYDPLDTVLNASFTVVLTDQQLLTIDDLRLP
jgi:hypothetical protein